ncbi:MAG: exodeoxyribonuclease VII large subunit [Saprospiraceae bacterium]|nr:exodeoxyribonuclease VII large subunit [Saprospiraceae bacterium]
MQTYSLFELNEYIRRILALNLPDAVWVTCEIAQFNESRGNYFLELVQKSEEEDTIIARTEAALWGPNYRQLRKKIGKKLVDILQEGLEVKVQVRVSFHERYGLKMVIEDVDPTYTLGKLALKRQQTIERLEEEGKMHQNAQLELPTVLQRIAVLSSPTAAGLQDFENQVRFNPFQYHFQLDLFPTAMQGDRVSEEMRTQLRKITKREHLYDAVVIIRGGGARLDLQAFNDYELCAALADCPIPILTGIGHDIDETVADMVAYQSLKTPTAVAENLVQHNALFEGELMQLAQQLNQISQLELQQAGNELMKYQQMLQMASNNQLQQLASELQHLEQLLNPLSKIKLEQEQTILDQLSQVLGLLDLDATLARGYSLTMKEGKVIQSKTELSPEDEIEIRFKDGSVNGKIH